MRAWNRSNYLRTWAFVFLTGISSISLAQMKLGGDSLPSYVFLREAPTESDFFVMLVGRIEVAEFRRSGSSGQLLSQEIGLSNEVASRRASKA
jgi:hypothetical protein